MADVHTITLEFLRHGPAHNQLLSPLTRYLALCENHSAQTAIIPFEHNHLLTRLQSLNDRSSEKSRQLNAAELAQTLAEILQQVPGLVAELCDCHAEDDSISHLQLILSASELALLPFELANAPNGFPGAGQPLTLQTSLPLCVTRKVRRVVNMDFQWPQTPRILFIAASPNGVNAIPLESHLLALRQIIDPWIERFDPANDEARHKLIEKHLVVLPQASIEAIMEKCRDEHFTHVHILAHGIKIKQGNDKRFGLALHHRSDPSKIDRVDGVQLANALRTSKRFPGDKSAHPSIVTLASCDSGNTGSVMGAGGSIAHSMHGADIPLVIASQFPLSFEGSVIMVQTLYEGMLWGDDPRVLLNNLRKQLKIQLPDTHDWASIVAYAIFPSDLTEQLMKISIKQTDKAINIALTRAEHAVNHQELTVTYDQYGQIIKTAQWPNTPPNQQPTRLSKAITQFTLAHKRFKYLLLKQSDLTLKAASIEKRVAQVFFHAAETETSNKETRSQYSQQSNSHLKEAFHLYQQAYEAEPQSGWAASQYLSMTLIHNDNKANPQLWEAIWHCVSLYLLTSKDIWQEFDTLAWANGDMAEVMVMALILIEKVQQQDKDKKHTLSIFDKIDIKQKIREHIQFIIDTRGENSFEYYASRRQLNRYVDWFATLNKPIDKIRKDLEAILEPLPHSKLWLDSATTDQ